MQFEAVRIAIAFICLLIASYFDLFNRRNVPVNIVYAMIAAGFLLNLATMDFTLVAYSTLTSLFVLAIGYLAYRTGQIGGADILVFAAIPLLFPSAPTPFLSTPSSQLIQYPFVLSVFIISGLLSIIGIAATYVPRVMRDALAGKVKISLTSALSAFLITISYLAVLYMLSQTFLLQPLQVATLVLLLLLTAFLLLFKDHISASMVEWVPFSQIDDEDVIDLEKLDPKLVAKYSLERVATKSQLERLKKTKLKTFPVFKGMPAFVPYILLALAILVLFGDPVWLLLS